LLPSAQTAVADITKSPRQRPPGGARLGLALALALAAQGAWACKFVQPTQPFSQRLSEAPLVFIGVVSQASDSSVVFTVEHPLRGIDAKSFTLPRTGLSSCHIRFGVGERWVFGGEYLMEPSMLLGRAEDASATSMGRLRRRDDSRLSLPAEWQICSRASQCVAVPYGCSMTSVVSQHESVARKQAWRIGGDPRMLECARPPANTPDFPTPLCVAGRCGAWLLDFR
jgi:hypothetical protein